jgi:hypothetical protein
MLDNHVNSSIENTTDRKNNSVCINKNDCDIKKFLNTSKNKQKYEKSSKNIEKQKRYTNDEDKALDELIDSEIEMLDNHVNSNIENKPDRKIKINNPVCTDNDSDI